MPRELRARKVGQLAGRTTRSLQDPAFAELLQRIDSGPVHPGHEVEIYLRGQAAFAAMREAMAGAREEILVESYILRDDATGRAFLKELARAVERGVSVRVLADAWGSARTRDAFWQEMRQQGIELRLFHPLFPYLWREVFRDHRKLLVVDRRVAFTGGMNIGEEYGSWRGRSEGSWRDTHVRVEGPAVGEMAAVFSEGWTHAGGEPFLVPAPQPEEGGGEARVLVLDSRPNRGYAESASVLAAIVGGARTSVWITNAYFAPPRRAVVILGRAVERGVDVRLLLPGTTDVPVARHAGHGYFEDLLERGVRVFEYQDAILHAKSLVADGCVSVVGSSNLDFRSFHFNAECNLVILDPATGRTMSRAFQEDLKRSVEIRLGAWRQRSLLHRTGDRLARLLSPFL